MYEKFPRVIFEKNSEHDFFTALSTLYFYVLQNYSFLTCSASLHIVLTLPHPVLAPHCTL